MSTPHLRLMKDTSLPTKYGHVPHSHRHPLEWLRHVMDTNSFLHSVGDPDALIGSEVCVLVAVASHIDQATLLDTHPAMSTISAETGISVRRVRMIMKRLRDTGWLLVKHPAATYTQPGDQAPRPTVTYILGLGPQHF